MTQDEISTEDDYGISRTWVAIVCIVHTPGASFYDL